MRNEIKIERTWIFFFFFNRGRNLDEFWERQGIIVLSLLHKWLECGPSNVQMRVQQSVSQGCFCERGVCLLIFLHLKNVSFFPF